MFKAMAAPAADAAPRENLNMQTSDRIIVALDVASPAAAEAIIERIGPSATFYKIGMELVYAGGLPLVRKLADRGLKVFLDLKLHDIPNTVEKAAARLADTGAAFLTVHAYPQTLAAAVKGRGGSPLKILGVSVLTSMNDDDLARAGYGIGVAGLVRRRARHAQEAGADGLVCAPTELRLVRDTVGEALALVAPGIRPAGSAPGDQKRVMTPAEAIAAGADHLVIGRPIMEAADPARAFAAVLKEIS